MTKATGGYTSADSATIETYNIHSDFHVNEIASDLNLWHITVNRLTTFKNCIDSIANDGTNVIITFNSNLGYDLIAGDEIELWGPLVTT